MKIILYCSSSSINPLTKAIKAFGHTVVGSSSTPHELIAAIGEYAPDVMISEIGHLVSSPQALALTIHRYPGLPTFIAYLQKVRWEADLAEFLARPRL